MLGARYARALRSSSVFANPHLSRERKGVAMKRDACAIFVSLAIVAGALGIAPGTAEAADYTIRLGTAAAPAHPLTRANMEFKKYLEERSKGRIEVRVLHSGQLGGVRETIEMVKAGTLTVAVGDTAFLENFVPKFGVINMPFVFPNREAAFAMLDGPIGQELVREMERAGFKSLGLTENGFRHITNNVRPVSTPDDLRGIKLRVQTNPVHLKVFRMLGANPIPMDWPEVYSALQQKVIDGQENPLSIIFPLKVYEVQKYLSLTGHFYGVFGVYMHKPFYDGLPKDLQQAVDSAARDSVAWHRKTIVAEEQSYIDGLRKAGIAINQPSPEQLKLFRDKVVPVYDDVRKVVGPDLMDRFLAALPRK